VNPEVEKLLTPTSRGDAMEVLGVRLGDPVAKLRRLEVTGGEPVGEFIYGPGGAVSRTLPDGQRRPLSLEEIVDLVVASGAGRLRVGGVMFQIEEHLVRGIYLGPEVLGGLSSETDVPRLLGPPLGTSKAYGETHFHYPERLLTASFHRERRSWRVVLAPSSWEPPRLGAEDLLQRFAEIAGRIKAHEYTLPADAVPPLRYRFEQTTALARALGIESLQALARGEFIGELPVGHPAIQRLARHWPDLNPAQPQSTRLCQWAYRDLLHYRCDAELLLRHNEGWLECSSPVLLAALEIASSTNRSLQPLLGEIEEVLKLFLDPTGCRTVFVEDLVREHGYPDVDLPEIDLENL